jgi:VWFA-related protein
VDLVEVNVSVTDGEGRPVRDLTREDFEVRESGRVQTVAIFDRVDIPLPPPAPAEAPRRAAVAADVAANDFRETGRAFAIVLDDLTQYPFHTQRTRNIARRFIEQHVGPEDLVLVMGTSGRAEVTQEFTTDKGRALQAVERFIGLLPLCPPEAKCPELPDRIDPDAELNIYRAQTLEAIDKLAGHLARLKGRRVSVLFIGDGFKIPNARAQPFGGGDLFASLGMFSLTETALLTGTERTAEALQGANTTFFAVRTDPGGGLGNIAKTGVLDALAEATGGMVGENNSSFVGLDFDRIIAETSHYYLLGYYPAERRQDGQYRSIDVRVRRAGVRVSHRPGYRYREATPAAVPPPTLAVQRAAPPPLATLLDSPMPTAGLPLRVQAIPLRGSDTNARVQLIVEVSGQDLAFEERDGRLNEVIEFATVAFDDEGRRSPERTTEVRLGLTTAGRDRVVQSGVRWISVLELPRGRHDLRVAARAVTTNRHGAVFADVDIPAFDTEMTTSGLAVTSRTAPAAFTTGGPLVLPPLPTPPTVERRFVLGDVLAVSAEVYQFSERRGLLLRRVTDPVPAELHIRVTEAAPPQRVVVDQPLPVMSEGHTTPYVSFVINTANVGAGRFVLRVVRPDQDAPDDLTPGAVPFEVVTR